MGRSTLCLAMMGLLLLAPCARAGNWSVSARGAVGIIPESRVGQAQPRVGLELDIFPKPGTVSFGFSAGWLEQPGSYRYIHSDDTAPHGPDEQHCRSFSLAGVARWETRVAATRQYVVAGAGEYVSTHRDQYLIGNDATITTSAPGTILGVGISGSTRPAATFDARWHHVFGSLDPFAPSSTDLVVLSFGLRFD